MQCVTAVSYLILLNDRPQQRFKPSKGIRQGDPLSPYLFIICYEATSCLLNKVERDGIITGLYVGRHQVSFNHLSFADDIHLFCKANCIEWSGLTSLLDLYEKASSQRLNKEKISIFFSSNTRQESKDFIIQDAGIQATNYDEKYMGLPSTVGRSRANSFRNIIDRVKVRISDWKTQFFSLAGKEVLLKSIIQAISAYCMGLFRLPKQLVNEQNKVVRSY